MIKKVTSGILIALAVTIGAGFVARETVFPMKDRDTIEKYAKEYNVKPERVAAFINFETGFDKVEYKEHKASGLMKLTEDTGAEIAKEIGDTNFKPEQIADDDKNIQYGTYYLSKSNGKSLEDTVGEWSIRNGEEKNEEIDMKEYAKKYYTDKIQKREAIYKILYFQF